MKKYRPSNGTEGIDFMGRFCDRCKKDINCDCPIIAATMAFRIADPEYPEEWQYVEQGRPVCTAFEKE